MRQPETFFAARVLRETAKSNKCLHPQILFIGCAILRHRVRSVVVSQCLERRLWKSNKPLTGVNSLVCRLQLPCELFLWDAKF